MKGKRWKEEERGRGEERGENKLIFQPQKSDPNSANQQAICRDNSPIRSPHTYINPSSHQTTIGTAQGCLSARYMSGVLCSHSPDATE